jgi:hypothetical protein
MDSIYNKDGYICVRIGKDIEIMMSSALRLCLVIGLLIMVSGCATPPAWMEGYRAIDEVDGLPVLELSEFDGSAPQRSMFADILSREEYARYQAKGTRAELFYISARHDVLEYVALDHPHTSATVGRVFNYFKQREMQSDDGVGVAADLATFWYRRVTLPVENRQCIIFNSEWDIQAEDALLRSDKVMFGYYCARKKVTLDKQAAIKIIDALGVRGINKRFHGEKLEIGGPATLSDQQQLSALAQGKDAPSEWGAAFPFEIGVSYSPSGGCSGSEC